MSRYTYSLPFTNQKFMIGIIYELKDRNKYDSANLLKGADIQVETDEYSCYRGGGRWNAMSAYIKFYVNPQNKKMLDTDENREILENICNELIPANVGFDVKGVSFIIDLSKDFEIEDDLI
ncbi:hypothetical protein ACV30Q_13965 [Clostridium perfringens]|uniref:hypothetical protein n=1 Tax=Clostridium perfringens TaxID=1502 RepID=UPI0013D51B97|nr:hypothetical protein [Clostridium perfringens]KAF2784965.1 hypothetical protein SV13_02360 [Clostridium perfringens]MBI5992611.1 hypothetical protein [Clostridium perfringens]MDK0724928.1 hypothetical protein [Clostridium perfringens]